MTTTSNFSDTLFFDTHAGIKELTAAGVPEKQAEAQIKILSDLIKKDLVTKGYLDMKTAEINLQISDLDKKMSGKIAENKSDLLKWMFTLSMAEITIIVGLIKLL